MWVHDVNGRVLAALINTRFKNEPMTVQIICLEYIGIYLELVMDLIYHMIY